MLNSFFWCSCPRKLGQLCQKNSFNTTYSHTSAITYNIPPFQGGIQLVIGEKTECVMQAKIWLEYMQY